VIHRRTFLGALVIPLTTAVRRLAAQQTHVARIGWLAIRWLAAIACIAALLSTGPAGAAPTYMSYFGLGRNIPEAQDHVNLYWAVSWDWNINEVLSQLADAKGRGMRAIVHTEFAFFTGSGAYGNSCPYTPRPDAAARWDSFAQALSKQGLLDTVAAFYPLDEPEACGLSSGDVLTALNVARAHPLTTGKPVAAIFGCEIAQKYGGPYRITGEHDFGDAVRAYDWAGVDCYGSTNIFTDPAWTTVEFDSHCFCFRRIPGPSYYDNFKAQLNLPAQRLILVPQGFIAPDSDGLPDDPQLFASQAGADPSVILMAPFTWFDLPGYPGVRSQPALAQRWRDIGKSIALSNPPNANPPLPPAVPPRLQVHASDVQHFSVYDLTCNTTGGEVCAIQLYWQAVDSKLGTQLFMRQGAGAPQLVTCSAAANYVELPSITAGISYTFDLYQMAGCPTTVATGTTPIARVNLSLVTPGATVPATVVEFHNASLDHYFITWVADEIAKLDAGTVIKGWTRTGETLKTYATAQTGTSPVCRYYIPPALGDSHFFGRGTVECTATAQKNPTFVLEDPAFMQMFLPTAGVCPPNATEVYRVFDNRPDTNHRYMTDKAVRDQMVAKGWLAEGDGPNMVVMCAPQ